MCIRDRDIIHALLTLSKVIAADPEVSKWLQVVFVENYKDVYKRQSFSCSLVSFPASPRSSAGSRMRRMAKPSFRYGTLIDVYKRQVWKATKRARSASWVL